MYLKKTWSTGSLLKKVDDQKKGNYNSSVNTSGDTDMTRAIYEARMRNEEICKEAIEMADKALKARGIYDPMLMRDGQLPSYEKIEEYRNLIADERQKFVYMLDSQFNVSKITKPINAGINYYE
jgi:hypothetical protein